MEFAVWTIRVASRAAAASVPDEKMAPEGPGVLGNLLDEIFFDFDRIGVLGQSEAFTQAGDVGVDHNAGFDPIGVAEDNVGSLASDSGKVGEGCEFAGDFAVMVLDE